MRYISLLIIIALYLTGCSINDSENNNTEIYIQADWENLEILKESGVDFSKKQLVDFQISVDKEKNGKKINEIMQNKGYKCTLSKDYEGDRWTLECSKELMLELNTLINIQKEINDISKQFNGYSDGWGVMVKP